MSEFDVSKYVKLITKIYNNYKLLKNDLYNEDFYNNLKSSLKELKYFLDNKLLPSDLYYKTLIFHDRFYTRMEGVYKGNRSKNNK